MLLSEIVGSRKSRVPWENSAGAVIKTMRRAIKRLLR